MQQGWLPQGGKEKIVFLISLYPLSVKSHNLSRKRPIAPQANYQTGGRGTPSFAALQVGLPRSQSPAPGPSLTSPQGSPLQGSGGGQRPPEVRARVKQVISWWTSGSSHVAQRQVGAPAVLGTALTAAYQSTEAYRATEKQVPSPLALAEYHRRFVKSVHDFSSYREVLSLPLLPWVRKPPLLAGWCRVGERCRAGGRRGSSPCLIQLNVYMSNPNSSHMSSTHVREGRGSSAEMVMSY